jgi:hypothetical protein
MPKPKLLFIFISCLLLLLLLPAACSPQGAEVSGTLAIYSPDKTVYAETAVAFREGENVLDILKAATRTAGIHMEYSGTGMTAYVKGIDNLYEFDRGPESGWVYTVNGTEIQQSAGAYAPEDGDAIVWQYILTLGTPPEAAS